VAPGPQVPLPTAVRGVGAVGQEAFAGFDITPDGLATVLAGELDQAALHGALNRIQALGLELLGVAREGLAAGRGLPGLAPGGG
jgi:ABC-type sugar transport system substrate-binding protein